jgi:preprotein translocase subunit SecD
VRIDHIVVQLRYQGPKRAIELIGKTARLEFKLVDENINPRGGFRPYHP